jgi:hypothetical protein
LSGIGHTEKETVMTYSYALPIQAIEESFEDAVRCLLDDEPLHIDLDLEAHELDELRSERHRIAIVWDALDVCELRPDLPRRDGPCCEPTGFTKSFWRSRNAIVKTSSDTHLTQFS